MVREWARAQEKLELVHLMLGERESSAAHLEDASSSLAQGLNVFNASAMNAEVRALESASQRAAADLAALRATPTLGAH